MRTGHFPNLHVPVLFVSGTKDPFGSIEELQAAIKLIPANTKLVLIEGAGHSLLAKQNNGELVSTVVAAFKECFPRTAA
jgi:predicted alpha/beta-hydrolase family hydrolase